MCKLIEKFAFLSFACCFFVLGLIKTATIKTDGTTNFRFPSNPLSRGTNHSASVGTGRLALARTFCEADANDLLSSFDIWDVLPPCKDKPSIPVDLALSFSRNLEKSPIARHAFEAVEKRFFETNGWNGCFDKMIAFGTDLSPEMDLYRPKEQGKNLNWVNGPNRQFERTVRVISEFGNSDYELMYLMEGDSVPLKPYWLDAFVSEITEMRPFAVLGSTYRGDKWDQFFNKIPSSLIHHTNGNAVYNVTHPFFLNLINELESEAKTPANNIAFDHRMQQIVQEGMIGVPTEQDHFPDAEPLLDRTAVFQQWNDQYMPEECIKESTVNGNYAATNMVRELVNDDVFVLHGAKMYKSWNSSLHGDITLVVSDWTEGNSRQLISSLDESIHPFSKVLVVQPADSPSQHTESGTPIEIHNRGSDPDFMDFCTATVTTDWFMITNSYFRLRPIVSIMVNENKNGKFKTVVSTVEADDVTCFPFKSCVQDLSIARHFLPHFKQVFQSDNMVFKTSVRNEFCKALKSLPVSKSLMATPASAYMAYVEAEVGGIQTLYKLSDRRRHGSRFSFVPIHQDKLPPIMANQHRRNLQVDPVGTNATKCSNWVTLEECTNNACLWRPDFMSCMEAPLADDSLDSLNGTKLQAESNTTTADLLAQFGNYTELLAKYGNFTGFGNMTTFFGTTNLTSFFSDTNNIYRIFGNATTFEAIFGTVENFMSLFGIPYSEPAGATLSPAGATLSPAGATSPPTEFSQMQSQEILSAVTDAPKETLPPEPGGEVTEEADVVEGPELCTVKVLVSGKTVKTMEIPCP